MKKMKTTILKTTIVVTVAAIFLTGCGGGSSVGGTSSLSNELSNAEQTLQDAKDQGAYTQDPSKIQKVEYNFNNDKVNCIGISDPADIVEFQTLTTCTWHCGDYEGARPVTVLLTFRRTNNALNGAWQLETDLVLNAPGACHD